MCDQKADNLERIRQHTQRWKEVDSAARRFTFFFAAQNNFFEEIAKFRAARRPEGGLRELYDSFDPVLRRNLQR